MKKNQFIITLFIIILLLAFPIESHAGNKGKKQKSEAKIPVLMYHHLSYDDPKGNPSITSPDNIIEMIYALDKIAPGTANEDTLLYGVEVKFYNSKVQVDSRLETKVKGLYVLGDGSGVTHSLSQAAASGILCARNLVEEYGQ
jgi:hypothetical protein